jgi:hypothetical protein
VLNTSSAGALSAGKWLGSGSQFSASTTRAHVNGQWDETYGIIYDFEGKIEGGKIHGRYRPNYLIPAGKEAGSWSELVYVKGDTAKIHDLWWKSRSHLLK